MILYQAVVILWVGSEVVIGVTHAAPLQAFGQDRWSVVGVFAGVFLAVWLGIGAARAFPEATIPNGRIVFGAGIALALTGIALRWWAVLSLGRFFTTRVMTRPDQTVVESGPYRLVRHPSYTGMMLTLLGILLSSANWLSLACVVLVLPGLAFRIRVEEAALLLGLGDGYRDYMKRTKRLVPFVV